MTNIQLTESKALLTPEHKNYLLNQASFLNLQFNSK